MFSLDNERERRFLVRSDMRAAGGSGSSLTLDRPPSPAEKDRALTYIENDPARLKGFAWLLYNLDEFIYVR